MDPGPPDSKRQRLTSWSSSSHGVSLPRPHSTSSPLPPPRAPTHHHPAAPYHHYPPSRPPEPPHSSGPPTPVHPSTPSQAQVHPEAERRHHEPEPYAPMQDHYQHQHQQHQQHQQHHQQHHHHHQSQPLPQHHHPPASPAHGAYHHYPPREHASVKREPAEDPHRPNSTGHASEAPPHPPSASSHHSSTSHQPLPPPSYAEGPPQRHMSYDNVHSVPPTPGGYRPPPNYPPPPPTPLSQPATYESHPGYSEPPFYGVTYSSSLPAKKKNTRASQACDQCRQLKAKCDETKPCKTCRDKGLECKYRDPIPKATDKAQTDILDGIISMQSTLTTLTDHFGRMENRLSKMETVFARGLGPSPAKTDPAAVAEAHHRGLQSPRGPHSPVMANGGSDSLETITMESRNTEAGSGSMERYPHEPSSLEAYYQQQDPSRQVRHPDQIPPLRMMVEDEVEAEPGPPVPPGEPAIPINHTTLAGLLLEWPSIRELTKHHIEREGIRYISEFPISQEQNRGPLIVYGRGEDAHHSRYSREPTEHGNVEMADDSSDMASPSPAADFGQLGGLSPSDMIEYRGGVLGADGNPDFSEAKVKLYVQSFKDNILNMHPIVQPKLLDYWVQHFLDTLPTTQPRSTKPHSVKPTFAIANNPMDTPGAKRKRSPDPDGFDGPQTAPPGKAGKPDRSIHSALILTVLALGKICLYRDSIPDVVHPSEQLGPTGSPVVRNGIPQSPGQSSPPSQSSHSHHSAQPSPRDASDRSAHSRRASIHGPTGYRTGYSLKKNYEVIPGLEYFAYATDILGNLAGAYNNMKDVYANIFASLYYGQLSRPLESFAFIHKASHKLQVIMRPSLDKLRNFKKRSEFIQDPKYNQLALAFWTCLQLESDLIAELPLPPSGLLSYEEDMPHPNMSLLQGFDQRVLDSYPGQLYLRTHLNSIHRMFYAPEDPNKPGQEKFRNVELVADAVSGMHWVAPSFAFKEEDDPADEILAARLRAKYWGAQMITYRPFIRQILQFTHSINNHPSSPNPPTYTEFRDGIIAPIIHPGAKTLNEIDPSVIDLARKGIKALIESTRAFHNVCPNRPIITNVFGTAHAQWGNMLVLSAAKKDIVLGKYIDDDVLDTLFDRTIGFLRQSAGMTSSLRVDMHILEGLQRDIITRRSKPDKQDSSSFSSNPGMHTPVIAPSSAPMQRTHSTDQSLGSQLRQSAPPPGS